MRLTPTFRVLSFIATVLFVQDVAVAQDLQRGLRNYREVLSGKKKLAELTTAEQQEVILVHQKLSPRDDERNGKSAECREKASRATRAASDLASQAKRLLRCAESEDLSDDCTSEARRVRSASSDYEDAISSLRSDCD